MSRLFLCAVFALGLLGAPPWVSKAFAERRVALVIGNSGYQNAPFLPNPGKDAKAIAAAFQKAGFDVVRAYYDLGYLQFSRAIRQFQDDSADADIAVVYYAGHGLELHGTNFLVPVDAKLENGEAADDEAITLERLERSVAKAKRLRVVILDACRDNPFLKVMRKTAFRGINPGGLADVDVEAGSDLLIAFAAKGGSEALDGSGDHSPYTTALLHNLFEPGLSVQLAFARVRDEVLKSTRNQQEPYVYGSLGTESVSLVPGPAQPLVQTASLNDTGAEKDYNLIQTITRSLPADRAIDAWKVYLNQYPSGSYPDLARKNIQQLGLPKEPPPQSPPPPSDEDRAWDRVKDSSDADAFRDFIKRYPTSPRSDIARLHLQAIEEELKAEQDREAARQALEQAKKRAEDASHQRAEQEAALAQAQQAAKAAEDARKKAEADAAAKLQQQALEKQRLDALRAKQEADAAAAKQKAEQEAALKRAQEAAKAAEVARKKAEADAAVKRQEEARQAALAAAAQTKQEAACKTEEAKLTTLEAAGRGGRADLLQLQQGLTCERLRPLVNAALAHANAMPDDNTHDQVALAQRELSRLGCFSGAVDGTFNDPTKAAIKRYENEQGKAGTHIDVTDDFVTELKHQTARVCPLSCPQGQIAQGEQCIAADKTAPIANTKTEPEHLTKQETAPARTKKTEKDRIAHHEEPKKKKTAEEHHPQRVIQQAARGSGHGGGGATIGVGF